MMTNEAKKVELERVRAALAHFTEQEARLSEELGEPSQYMSTDPPPPVREEDYDAVSPSDAVRLFHDDRPRWEALVRAKHEAGMQRLVG